MGINRVFFPQMALDQWLGVGLVDLQGDELTILAEGRRYRIVEAAHIVREVSGQQDGNELVGKVKTRVFLGELGAELMEGSMVLGDNAYDIVPGFLAAPVGSFAQHMADSARSAQRPTASSSGPASTPASDEELLAQFLLKSL
jgi:hypothetical protein